MKTVVAILCLTALDAFALSQGIDGKILIGIAIAISGLGGYPIVASIFKKTNHTP